ncbi:MAG: 50S ribosomal protein L25 [Lachnoclostridium sp.]|jgi:large subunit ribosomal protein L25
MTVLLNATERKEHAKKVRRFGYIPGNIYGPGVGKNLNIQIDKKEVNKLLQSHALGAKTRVKINEREVPCVIKDVQYAPLVNGPIHIEFYASSEDKVVKVKVPLIFKGKELITKSNLVLNILEEEVEVQGLLKDLPEFIEIDVSSMRNAGTIKMKDIPLPEGIKLLSKKDETVAIAEKANEFKQDEEEANETEGDN